MASSFQKQAREEREKAAQGADERKPLFSLFVTRGAKAEERRWIGWHPTGPYDFSDLGVEERLSWHFNTGNPLFRIADLSTVWLIADVQEQDLGGIRVGQPVRINFVAFPGRTFTGKVDFLYPTVMATTRAGRVRIVLPNPDGAGASLVVVLIDSFVSVAGLESRGLTENV